MRSLRWPVLSLTASALIIACDGGTGVTPELGQVRATLRRAMSCADLEQALKSDALAKMNKSIDAQIRSIQRDGSVGTFANASAVPETGGTAQGSDKAASDVAASYSGTNTQVAGVDEADLVKNDGKRIYLLHGQTLTILNAWPAASLAPASRVDIEGEPTEMFQWPGKLVVYSRVDGAPIYAAAGLAPRSSYGDYPYAMGAADIAAPYPMGGKWIEHPLLKVTVLDVQGASASVARELYFEGSYLSSRRIGAQVRTVLGGAAPGPAIKTYPDTPMLLGTRTASEAAAKEAWIAALERLRSENTIKIESSKVTDWIPYAFAKTSAGVTGAPLACEDFYLPTPGSTRYGLTHIETFDAETAGSPVKTAAIVGQADTVYANEKTMILAAHAWVEPDVLGLVVTSTAPIGAPSTGGGGSSGGGTGSSPAVPPSAGTQRVRILAETADAPPTVTMDWTHLHAFDLATDVTTARYFASGTVPGSIQNQFSLDEKNGTVRVTTTERRGIVRTADTSSMVARPTSANHVMALEEHDGALDLVGSVGDLAPGETIMSTRFVGDTAYVVTFLQKDPLFVVDVSDAHALAVLGQLTIPGFSSYMHPLDAKHLLTIGQDDGLALQIFDVTHPASPQQTAKFVYRNEYGFSEAQSNHKAFTYFADRGLLAFPYLAYGSSSMKSTLELFKIDAARGIERVGGIDHTAFFGAAASTERGYCGGYFEPAVRRGLFMENVVYSISYGGVIASDATTLATITSVGLPEPVLGGYPGCAVGRD